MIEQHVVSSKGNQFLFHYWYDHCSQIRVIGVKQGLFDQIRPLHSTTVIVVKSIHCIQIHSLYSNPVIVHKHIHYAQTYTIVAQSVHCSQTR